MSSIILRDWVNQNLFDSPEDPIVWWQVVGVLSIVREGYDDEYC